MIRARGVFGELSLASASFGRGPVDVRLGWYVSRGSCVRFICLSSAFSQALCASRALLQVLFLNPHWTPEHLLFPHRLAPSLCQLHPTESSRFWFKGYPPPLRLSPTRRPHPHPHPGLRPLCGEHRSYEPHLYGPRPQPVPALSTRHRNCASSHPSVHTATQPRCSLP